MHSGNRYFPADVLSLEIWEFFRKRERMEAYGKTYFKYDARGTGEYDKGRDDFRYCGDGKQTMMKKRKIHKENPGRLFWIK